MIPSLEHPVTIASLTDTDPFENDAVHAFEDAK
jgi:hypothetical protein